MFQACGLPLYWREPLFFAAGGHKHGYVTLPMFNAMWKRYLPYEKYLVLVVFL